MFLYFDFVFDILIIDAASCEDALQHPHVWIRLSSCQLFGLLFGAWTPEEVVRISKDGTSKYLYWAKDLSAKVNISDFVSKYYQDETILLYIHFCFIYHPYAFFPVNPSSLYDYRRKRSSCISFSHM